MNLNMEHIHDTQNDSDVKDVCRGDIGRWIWFQQRKGYAIPCIFVILSSFQAILCISWIQRSGRCFMLSKEESTHSTPTREQSNSFSTDEVCPSTRGGIQIINHIFHNPTCQRTDLFGISMGATLSPVLLLAICAISPVGNQSDGGLPIYATLSIYHGLSFSSSIFFWILSWHFYGHTVNKSLTIDHKYTLSRKTNIFKTYIIIYMSLAIYEVGTILHKSPISSTSTISSNEVQSFFQCLTVAIFSLINIAFSVSYVQTRHDAQIKTKCCGEEEKTVTGLTCTNHSWQQHVLTLGEWMTITPLLSILITDYIMTSCAYYFNMYFITPSAPVQGRSDVFIPHSLMVPMMTRYPHITIAQAGIFGCICGCCLPTMLNSRVVMDVLHSMLNGIPSKVRASWRVTCAVECSLLIVGVVFVTLCSVDNALRQKSYFLGLHEYAKNESEGIEWSLPMLKRLPYSPSLQWIQSFIFNSQSLNDEVGIESKPQLLTTWLQPQLQRWHWLVYWIGILIITGIVSCYIAKRLLGCKCRNEREKHVVMARKFFHAVAILLFLPTTYFDPDFMSFSYAIAIALLCVVERMRMLVSKIEKPIQAERQSLSHQLMKDGRPNTLTIETFYTTFFDEKDKGANEGGVVVTHISLVLGCAFPLWIHQWCLCASSTSDEGMKLSSLLPYIGLITIGVGDAMGAIVGTLVGSHKWPGSSRTIEGSMAMFLAMHLCMMTTNWKDVYKVLVPVVLLEATTKQIDNLCLPLVGSVLLLCL